LKEPHRGAVLEEAHPEGDLERVLDPDGLDRLSLLLRLRLLLLLRLMHRSQVDKLSDLDRLGSIIARRLLLLRLLLLLLSLRLTLRRRTRLLLGLLLRSLLLVLLPLCGLGDRDNLINLLLFLQQELPLQGGIMHLFSMVAFFPVVDNFALLFWLRLRQLHDVSVVVLLRPTLACPR